MLSGIEKLAETNVAEFVVPGMDVTRDWDETNPISGIEIEIEGVLTTTGDRSASVTLTSQGALSFGTTFEV